MGGIFEKGEKKATGDLLTLETSSSKLFDNDLGSGGISTFWSAGRNEVLPWKDTDLDEPVFANDNT